MRKSKTEINIMVNNDVYEGRSVLWFIVTNWTYSQTIFLALYPVGLH